MLNRNKWTHNCEDLRFVLPSVVVGGLGRLSGFLVEPLVGARGVRLVPSLGLNTALKEEQQLPILTTDQQRTFTQKAHVELSKHSRWGSSFLPNSKSCYGLLTRWDAAPDLAFHCWRRCDVLTAPPKAPRIPTLPQSGGGVWTESLVSGDR
jgi:hypothetical protein